MNEQSTQREMARGKTGIVFFDDANRKVAPIPEVFRDIIVSLPVIAKPFPDLFE
jgi:acyl-CoA thioester hydrolase